MIIKYKEYTIEPDVQSSWTLYEHYPTEAKQDGKEYKKGDKYIQKVIIGYYGKLENVIYDIVKIELAKNNDIVTLTDCITEYKKLYEEVKTFVIN